MSIKKLIREAACYGRSLRTRAGQRVVGVHDLTELALTLGLPEPEGEFFHGYIASENAELGLGRRTWDKYGKLSVGYLVVHGDDIVGPWMEFNYWDAIDERFNFMAMNDQGQWRFFAERPTASSNGGGYWEGEHTGVGIEYINLPRLGREFWYHSLIERPNYTEDC